MTVGEVIDLVQRDFPESSDAEILDDIQQIHDKLCFTYPLIEETQVLSSLAVGTRGYSLASGACRVRKVRYKASASSQYQQIDATTLDTLEYGGPGWRDMPNGVPYQYYVKMGQINFVPAPATASTGSPAYPRIEVDIHKVETLTSGSNLPAGLASYQAWVTYGKARAAFRLNDARYSELMRQHQEEVGRLHSQIFLNSTEVHQRIDPRISSGGRGVV